MNIVKFKNKYYKEVNSIYKESFPKEERYISLNRMIKSDNTDLYCLIEKEIVCGIIYLIKYESTIFILYLAVNSNKRANGYGSYMLKWCLDQFNNYKIFLNIEEINDKKPDFETRKRRLKFYLNNGFYLTNIISKDENEKFHVLSNQKKINVNEYIKLDNYVAKVLNEPFSDIKEIDLNKLSIV